MEVEMQNGKKQAKKATKKEMSEDEYHVFRRNQMKEAREKGMELYPHKYEVKNSMKDAREKASACEQDEIREETVQSAGRIVSIRASGKNLYFIEVESCGVKMQLIVRNNEKLTEVAAFVRRGDIVGFGGRCGRSKSNEPSVFLEDFKVLSVCQRVIPGAWNKLTNPELLARKRYLDLLMNPSTVARFRQRSMIIRYIRNYLESKDFLDVETPMMNKIHGGAAAKPFMTHHNALNQDLYMRVAPELYLKQLIVGGMDRVFEIGKQFRNEGIDLTHNPEFTSVEFYQAYADYKDMMAHVEELLSGLVEKFKGSRKFVYRPLKREENGSVSELNIPLDFSTPFRRIEILPELNRILGLSLAGSSITAPETLKMLLNKARELGLSVEAPHTITRVLDKFVSTYIEPQCINPTFVVGFPAITSPLSKEDRATPGLTERFELFINCKEICNAYTELNIPEVQRERFLSQMADKAAGDDEAMPIDEDFCAALEYGLAPTGGCGIGIDRLVMYLTDAANIRDVLLFPAMKPEEGTCIDAVEDN